jgi:ketosteroid isomerase-like protein
VTTVSFWALAAGQNLAAPNRDLVPQETRNDQNHLARLLVDDFVGWPCSTWTPTGKADIGAWVERIRDNNWTLTYELRPAAIQLFGDVAIVHYVAEYIFGFGNGTTKGAGEWRKFTHTWMKVGDEWQIIGGMCANQEPARAPNESCAPSE